MIRKCQKIPSRLCIINFQVRFTQSRQVSIASGFSSLSKRMGETAYDAQYREFECACPIESGGEVPECLAIA